MQTSSILKFRTGVLFVALLTLAAAAFAASIDGVWTATFNTQIGEQNYTYTFKANGEKLTGTAKGNFGETPIEDGVVKGDDISFTENLDFQGNKLAIKYTGKVNGDEIKFKREVGTFATEEFVAKRKK